MFPPPPIRLLILDELVDEPSVLANCTLVSRGWRAPAQQRLFDNSFVIFEGPPSPEYARIVESTPATASLLKHVKYYFDTSQPRTPTVPFLETNMEDTLDKLQLHRLQRLSTLHLDGSTPQGDCAGVLLRLRPHVHTSTLSSCLIHLVLANVHFPDVDTVKSVLALFPSLTNLSLISVDWLGPGTKNNRAPVNFSDLALHHLAIIHAEEHEPNDEAFRAFLAWILTTRSSQSLERVSYMTDWLGVHDPFLHFIQTLSEIPGSDLAFSFEEDLLLQFRADEEATDPGTVIRWGERVKEVTLRSYAFDVNIDIFAAIDSAGLRHIGIELINCLTDIEYHERVKHLSLRHLYELQSIEVSLGPDVKRLWKAAVLKKTLKTCQKPVSLLCSPGNVQVFSGAVDDAVMGPDDLDFEEVCKLARHVVRKRNGRL